MNITIMWMKEWVELYTFCKIRVSTLTVKRIFSGIQNPLQIFSSVAINHPCMAIVPVDIWWLMVRRWYDVIDYSDYYVGSES